MLRYELGGKKKKNQTTKKKSPNPHKIPDTPQQQKPIVLVQGRTGETELRNNSQKSGKFVTFFYLWKKSLEIIQIQNLTERRRKLLFTPSVAQKSSKIAAQMWLNPASLGNISTSAAKEQGKQWFGSLVLIFDTTWKKSRKSRRKSNAESKLKGKRDHREFINGLPAKQQIREKKLNREKKKGKKIKAETAHVGLNY